MSIWIQRSNQQQRKQYHLYPRQSMLPGWGRKCYIKHRHSCSAWWIKPHIYYLQRKGTLKAKEDLDEFNVVECTWNLVVCICIRYFVMFVFKWCLCLIINKLFRKLPDVVEKTRSNTVKAPVKDWDVLLNVWRHALTIINEQFFQMHTYQWR